jgi:hypothetical protein
MEDLATVKSYNEDSAVARKRRKAILTSLRSSSDIVVDEDERSSKRPCTWIASSSSSDRDHDDCNSSHHSESEDGSTVVTSSKPSIRGIKKQARYVPGVAMSKDELKNWRKEARRVRNRESAAASRNRTRQRIDELEGEVAILKSKYSEALQKILDLQSGTADSFTPDRLRQDLLERSRSVSPTHPSPSSPTFVATVSPPLSPRDLLTLPEQHQETMHPKHLQGGMYEMKHREPMDMIFRPTVA